MRSWTAFSPQMHEDPVRGQIDDAVGEALDLDAEWVASVRRELAREPSVMDRRQRGLVRSMRSWISLWIAGYPLKCPHSRSIDRRRLCQHMSASSGGYDWKSRTRLLQK